MRFEFGRGRERGRGAPPQANSQKLNTFTDSKNRLG